MNSHTSPCDHMTLFVAKSSPEQTRVPRRVTGRLTVHHLVNINPSWPRTSSTAHQENASITVSVHQEVNPRASSSLSTRVASSSEPSRKRWREEVPPPPHRRAREGAAAPARRARGGAAASARRAREGEAAPARGGATAPACRGEAAPA
jgi:hypothetical protein